MELTMRGFLNIKPVLFNIKEILKWADEQEKATVDTLKKITATICLAPFFYNSAFIKIAGIDRVVSNKPYLITRVISLETRL